MKDGTSNKRKSWVKSWWGIIIAIFFWPITLLWLLWRKENATNLLGKLAGSVGVFVLAIIAMFVMAGASGQNQNLGATKTASSTPTTPTTTSAAKPKPSGTPSTTSQKNTSPKPSTSPTQTATTPQHTIIYQFAVIKGTLSDADQQQVGISWGDPNTGNNKIPDDIGAAIQQVASSGYSVTFHVSNVNNNNLLAGVNNLDESDATLACTIFVDGQMIDTEVAPPSGSSQCAGYAPLRQSSSN